MLSRRLRKIVFGTRASARGQTVPIVVVFLVVLVGFAALAVDYGSYLLARRNYQTLADAASLAGSAQLSRPINATKQGYARAAAWEALDRELGLTFASSLGVAPTGDIGVDGYTDGPWKIWVDTPPTAAGTAYFGNAGISGGGSVFVRVERENPAFLSRFFGFNGRTIQAWATSGTQPSRWAVLALCTRAGPCPSSSESIKINGQANLRIVDGDLGGNWKLKIDGNTPNRLQLPGDSEAYLADTTCGSSLYLCYPDPNVSNGSGVSKLVKVLPALAQDPNYAEPPWLTDATAVPPRPNIGPPPASGGTVINSNATNVGCDPTDPTTIRIGPGRYSSIRIGNSSCVIFDPTFGLTVAQRPGIYYITGQLDIGNSSFVIGDGVSIFFASGMSPFNPNWGVALNVGNAGITSIPTGESKYGAWTTKGNTPWSVAVAGSPVPTTTWTTPSTSEIGIAFYIRRNGASYTSVFNMSGNTPLMFQGVLYGPQDNVAISGTGSQAAVGQIVSWTITYGGNTTITQIFDGPADAKSYLLEPRTGQPD